jgi:hypothetical protein
LLETPDTIEETSREVLGEVEERRLERTVNAYRLTGRTIFEHREDLAVRLDIAYKGGHYKEDIWGNSGNLTHL